jgi:hypothetical protein
MLKKAIYFIGFHTNIIRDDFSRKGYATNVLTVVLLIDKLRIVLQEVMQDSKSLITEG